MKIQYSAISKTGRRSNNEDAFKVIEDTETHRWLGIVCDGMGGHAMGEVASELVVNAVADYWGTHREEPDSEMKVQLACAIASKQLDERAEAMCLKEMGTTLVMVSIENDMLTIAHVGDSSCYVMCPQKGLLYRTQDHIKLSFGWEIISRCFFSFQLEKAVPDVKQLRLCSGCRILLCSDGIYKSIDSEILRKEMTDDKTPEEVLDVFDSLCNRVRYYQKQ